MCEKAITVNITYEVAVIRLIECSQWIDNLQVLNLDIHLTCHSSPLFLVFPLHQEMFGILWYSIYENRMGSLQFCNIMSQN